MRILTCFVIVVAAGCTTGNGSGGGGGGGGGVDAPAGAGATISGDLPGGAFSPADTISDAVMVSDGNGGTAGSARIMMATTASLCGDAGTSPPTDRKNERFVTLDLRDTTGATTTAPAAPGTYTIYPDTGSVPPKAASLYAGAFDATCQPVDADAAQAQSGTVTLTAITGGAFKGSFDVVLNTGGHITGSFAPAACAALATAAASTDPHSCL